jgi:hypothetical protein
MASNHDLREISVQDLLVLKMAALLCQDLADRLLFRYLNRNWGKNSWKLCDIY